MTEKKRRITQITIETHTLTIVRQGGETPKEFCQICQKFVPALSAVCFARLLNLTLNELCQNIETGNFHLIRDAGVALVCADCVKYENNKP